MEFHCSMKWEDDTRLKRLLLLLLYCVHSSAAEGMLIGAFVRAKSCTTQDINVVWFPSQGAAVTSEPLHMFFFFCLSTFGQHSNCGQSALWKKGCDKGKWRSEITAFNVNWNQNILAMQSEEISWKKELAMVETHTPDQWPFLFLFSTNKKDWKALIMQRDKHFFSGHTRQLEETPWGKKNPKKTSLIFPNRTLAVATQHQTICLDFLPLHTNMNGHYVFLLKIHT